MDKSSLNMKGVVEYYYDPMALSSVIRANFLWEGKTGPITWTTKFRLPDELAAKMSVTATWEIAAEWYKECSFHVENSLFESVEKSAMLDHLAVMYDKLPSVCAGGSEPWVKTEANALGYVKSVSYLSGTPTSKYDEARELSRASKNLPGMQYGVLFPCSCYTDARRTVWSIVQHLNDDHPDWNREKIADWIDELQDKHGLNMEFQVEVE